MSKALWPSVSGAIARDHQVEVIANNLANVNTQGFKKDQTVFKEYLAQEETPDAQSAPIPRSPIKDKDLYPLEGRDQSYVVVEGTHTRFTPGPMKVTDNPLDVALEGKGFLEILTPQGVRYHRGGSLKINSEGTLVTTEGFPVLSKGDPAVEGGDQPAARTLNIKSKEGNLQINDQGELYLDDRKVGSISIVEFGDLRGIKKTGNGIYENKSPVPNPPQAAAQTLIKQGMIEGSNVNPVEELTELIRANRMFEQNLKGLKTVSELMSKEVTDLPKIQ